jgi:GT2 family glycosyltransferase
MDKNYCRIIIVSLNQLHYTKQCLESIFKNTQFPHKILVVDNNSNQETASYLRKLEDTGKIEVIFNKENKGWVDAVNQGIFYDRAPYVCVMNNDTVVYPDWLEQMAWAMQQNEKIGLVNPLWQVPKRFKNRDNYYSKVILNQKKQYIDTDWARGFCFLASRELINIIGGLDQDYAPAYYDDWDYSMRAIAEGFRCVRAQGAFVYHFKNITYPDFLGTVNFNRIFKEKQELFHRRWGMPKKILVIVDKTLALSLGKVKDFIIDALRAQHRVFLIGDKIPLRVRHTNYKGYSSIIHPGLSALFNILNNLRRSKIKRYDFIICSKATKRFLEAIPALKNKISIVDFENVSKKQIQEIING